MEDDSDRPTKRFKHQSYQATLKSVHLPSASAQSRLDDDIPDSESHFHNALDHWRQLNLSPAFLRFASKVQGLSASVPLLLHHSQEIVGLWIEATEQADDDSWRALLDLLQKLVHDLRTTLGPSYRPLLEVLLAPLTSTLSADTLTVLLATLSSLFKHLLSSNSQFLSETWLALSSTLPRCNPEVQRAVAEVWATVLRRCKGEVRESAVSLVMQRVETTSDVSAWMFVYAFKSVAHTLHTCTSTLFDALLSAHLALENRTRTESLMRRVMTALIHHCDKAEQFSPISDILTSRFASTTAEDELPFVMNLLSVACSVRRGSRVTQKQLSCILTYMVQKPALSATREQVLMLGTAALVAGEMPVWMGPGRRFIEMTWEAPSLGLELSGALSALDWGGWRLIQLPFTLKHTALLLDDYAGPTLTLLAVLARAGKLDDADERWLQKISLSVHARLEAWTMNEEFVQELANILAISSLLPSLAPELVHIASRSFDALQQEDASEGHSRTRALAGNVFGACLKALAGMPSREWGQQVDIPAWTVSAVKGWGSCETALCGLVAISRQQHNFGTLIPLTEVYPSLEVSVLSHSRPLRLSALQLLTSSLIEPAQCKEVLNRCLQGEEATLDVHGARERVIRITAAPQLLKEGDETGADMCGRWLIAQLKVNLRPLWGPAAKALAVLAQRFGDLVWKLLFTELDGIIRAETHVSAAPVAVGDPGEEPENERSWRDPSAAKLRAVIDKWTRGVAGQSLVPETPPQRLDVVNYEAQLLHTLGEAASLTQRHNADLVRLFLSFASPELPLKPSRTKLNNWLTLFSKLDNPKSFHRTTTLQTLYRSLLSHPDRALQSIALTCVLNYKSPHLMPYESHLHAFLDNTKWRDELTSFDIAGIEEGDRGEAVDVIVRLFFGLMLERHGRTKGADRRASLLGALGGCHEGELRPLIDLMLEPFSLSSSSDIADNLLVDSSEKQQTGFMNLLGDVLKRMGSRLVPYWPALLLATIALVTRAQKRLEPGSETAEDQEEEDIEDVEGIPVEDVTPPPLSKARPTRTVRQLGIKRFTDFFRCDTAFDFRPYIPSAFKAFISPRLASLDRENTQSPSAILELFHVWSTRREYVSFLVDYDNRVLPQVYACLRAVNVKPLVVSRIYDIVEYILALSEGNDEVAERVLKPHISSLLDALSAQLPSASSSRNDLLHRQVGILSQVAPFTSDASQAQRILQHFLPFLKRPSKVIPEKIKVHLLKITQGIIPMVPDFREQTSVTYVQTYDLFAKLFQSLRTKQARIALLDAFNQLSLVDPSLCRVYGLLAALNAFSDKRMDEPDFNRRLQAFTELNDSLYSQLSSREWQPIIFNMLQFIQDPEELAVRANAAFSLKRFIDVLSSQGNPEIETLFMQMFLPGLKNGLLSKIELVRNEVLGVIAYGVLKCDSIPSLNELRPLLAHGDAEADFFNNIHHIQIHRRTRALRRLVEYVESGTMRSATLADVFVPLVSHFILNAPTMDHILVDVAIATTGALARHLNWGAYNALVRQYMKLIKNKERACVRALVAILENFHFPMNDLIVEEPSPADIQTELFPDGEDENFAAVGEETLQERNKSIPVTPVKRISDAVNVRLLPSLLQHLEKREENDDVLRIPIAIGIVQVARHLPKTSMEGQVSRLLTVLCQVFRSKSQDTRALARETLCKIAVILGPSYLAQIMTELRAALLRGPHLHVLATVAHALLVHATSPKVTPPFDNLDSCAADVAHVSAEVIFGQSGRDVQTEGFKTTILEVRGSSSKGLDALAILAKHVTPPCVSVLLSPIRGIMHETEAAKTLQVVDDVLRRISGGLNANAHLMPSELLVLCHTLIQQNARFLKEAPRPLRGKGRTKGHFTVQMKRRLDQDADHYAQNSFRFVAFGLNLFNTAFRRGRFDLNDPQIIARLEPMVSIIGNTLYSQDALVVIQGLKATASIIKCPLKSVEESHAVFVRQTLEIVRQAGNTESEVVQTAFRTLAVIIRDCTASRVMEKDLVYLLEVLTPDLEEPNRQAAVFGLLRAIVSRKFVVAEIYDIMDKVAEIMVTNQSAQVQELCRAVLLQFLLDYPQGKGRLRTQMTFLAQNLSYVYESGRRSVMELLNAIFAKFDPGLLREHADLFFVALVMVMANDDSAKCREMAAELIKNLFTHLDDEHRRIIVSHLHSWSSQKARVQLSRVSAQVYGLVVDTLQQDMTPYLSSLLEDLNEVVRRSAMELQELESSPHDASGMDVDVEWQLPYHALNVISKVLRVHPELTKDGGKINWTAIGSHLLFPHAWVRNASSRLVGSLFNVNPPAAPAPDIADDRLVSLSGLIEVSRRSCLQLKSDTLDTSLSLQVVKNLFYTGKCFCMISKSRAFHTPASLPEDIAEGEDNAGDQDAEDKLENIRNNPLPWLFSKLSYQARSSWIARRNRSTGQDNWSEQPLAILRWFAAMTSHMEPESLESFLVHILSPVYRILDDDTVKDAQIGDLKSLAQELLELVQNKVGTTKFADVYNRIRQSIVAVRRERKNERVIQTTLNPQLSAHRKIQRNLAKKDNRARKDRTFAEGKIRNTRTKSKRRIKE